MRPAPLTTYPTGLAVWEYPADKWGFCYCCMKPVPEGEKLFEDRFGTDCEACWSVMQKHKGIKPTGDLLVTSKAKRPKKEAPVPRKAKKTKAEQTAA